MPRSAVAVGELGGTIFAGGDGYGFRWVQVRIGEAAAGMTVELLIEWQPEQNDFLARFLQRHGPGQHHLTFKVPDLAATLGRVQQAGFRPVSVNLTDPNWKEAFLQPREAHGTVVQLAQVHPDHPGTPELVVGAEAGTRVLRARVVGEAARARGGSRAAAACRAGDAVARRRRWRSSPASWTARSSTRLPMRSSSRGRVGAGSGSSTTPTPPPGSAASKATAVERR